MTDNSNLPRIALFQPDIPGNTGTILRLGACLGLGIDIIGPAGFDLSDRALKRAGMDYLAMANMRRHDDWTTFCATLGTRKLVLATTKATRPYWAQSYGPGTTILFGRESAGLPDEIHALGHDAVTIPMQPGLRSLNLAVSVAIIAGEALRQSAL